MPEKFISNCSFKGGKEQEDSIVSNITYITILLLLTFSSFILKPFEKVEIPYIKKSDTVIWNDLVLQRYVDLMLLTLCLCAVSTRVLCLFVP